MSRVLEALSRRGGRWSLLDAFTVNDASGSAAQGYRRPKPGTNGTSGEGLRDQLVNGGPRRIAAGADGGSYRIVQARPTTTGRQLESEMVRQKVYW
jgi:hypothetical protein